MTVTLNRECETEIAYETINGETILLDKDGYETVAAYGEWECKRGFFGEPVIVNPEAGNIYHVIARGNRGAIRHINGDRLDFRKANLILKPDGERIPPVNLAVILGNQKAA